MTSAPLTISAIVMNAEGLYEGNLASYFRALVFHARNLTNPYHNFRHMFHTAFRCYEACVFYGERLSKRQIRELLIAALFHDFDHSGRMGNDDLNIEMAIRGLRKHIAPEDQNSLARIEELIRCTEYPHKVPSSKLDLSGQILRDADVSQALDTSAWIQQVVFGLAKEWEKQPLELLRAQLKFHTSLVFETEWAKAKFPKTMVDERIKEARQLLALLEE